MRGFIEELRYRNVFRVAVAYVVAGWLIAQVADLAADAFNAPDWVMKMLIVILLIGLPVALFLAWAYELTPDGVKRAKDLPEDAPKDPRAGRRLNRITMVALIVAVAWLGWDKLQGPSPETGPVPGDRIADTSIAVLPFADFSPDSDHAWFADGLTDEILNALARTRSLRVASRTSSFAYRDTEKDATTIATELNVAHILEGSVRRAGDRIRVTAQLIRARDDAHLWSETFDASSDDSIAIQEQIAFDIASLLDTAMDPAELRKMVAAGTESIAAWEAYVRLREEFYRSIDQFDPLDSGPRMLRLYREIVAQDPEFGEAHLLFAELVDAWLSPAAVTSAPPELSRDALEDMFRQATADAARYARNEDDRLGAEILRARVQLRLADIVDLTRERLQYHPGSREVWSGHITALVVASRFDEARAFAREILDHDFGNDDLMATAATMVARVDLDAGLALVESMLAPTSPVPADLYQAHRILLMANRIAEANEVGQRYISAATNPMWSLMVNVRQACAEGRIDDAERLYEEFDFSPIDPANNNIQWLTLRTLGRIDEAVELLRPLDQQPETLVRLSELLSYTHFDPSPYPNLTKRLEEQGIMRYEIQPMNFACKR
jgi:TolB-like protein/tetratricopeptide (TPR) repeat protein